jgi:hypothetical protein
VQGWVHPLLFSKSHFENANYKINSNSTEHMTPLQPWQNSNSGLLSEAALMTAPRWQGHQIKALIAISNGITIAQDFGESTPCSEKLRHA